MQATLESLQERGLEKETEGLQGFYRDVRVCVHGITDAEGKQKVIAQLYQRFFKLALPKAAASLGIVFTPVEIVDYIIRSVEDILNREFGASVSDEDVHVLDPFVGTGTFISRLLRSGLIRPEDLNRKYESELHANEIMLMAYYVAAMNIESTYHDLAGATEHHPFNGIVLTDTFQSYEKGDPMDEVLFPRNNERIERQKGLDIRVIISNPPWSRGQGRHEDDNPNQRYPTLDKDIASSYVARSASKGLKNPLYDSAIRAIRWASNRVHVGNGGIVAFVTNSGFLGGKSFDGFRKTLAKEFHSIYVYDLRGNQYTSGETSQREGGKAFGSGSRAGVAVLLLVKQATPVTGTAAIYYHDIGDYLSRERKLETLEAVQFDKIMWSQITPNEQGDWTKQRSETYLNLRPVALIQSEDSIPSLPPLFKRSSIGVITNRDAWSFNSSKAKLQDLAETQVTFYNGQVEALTRDAASLARDSKQFKWDLATEQRAKRGVTAQLDPSGFQAALYRPFYRQHFCMNPVLSSALSQIPTYFPTPDTRNPAIVVERGLTVPGRDPAVLATNIAPDNKAAAGASGRAIQVLPRYTFVQTTETAQEELLPIKRDRQDNVSDDALAAYRKQYGPWVTKDQIFAYIYGILHSPIYKKRYTSDLALMLPRIPEVATSEAFRSFADAGQRLLDLHIGYEDAACYGLDEVVKKGAPEGAERYRVQKMGWVGSGQGRDRSAIVVNDWITLMGIPEQAHEYLVGPRSALEWLIDRHQVRTDKDTGIVNDPNDWGLEIGNPRYIVDLVKRITTVSVETMKIVSTLPTLETA